MAVKFANLASTTLASSLDTTATSVSVTSSSSFPTLGTGDYFYASIGEGSESEIVKVTGVSSNTFTVVRAQDSTSARSHPSGTVIALRVVAAALDDIAEQAQTAADTESVSLSGDTMTGSLNMGDNDITDVNHLVFDSGVRLMNATDSQIHIRGGASNVALEFKTSDSTRRGLVYGNSSNQFGLLDSDYNWFIRHTRDIRTDFLVNNVFKARIDDDKFYHVGQVRAPIFYDYDDTNYYLDADNTGTSLRVAGNIVSGDISSGDISSGKITASKSTSHTTGTISHTHAAIDLYNPLQSDTDEKGAILTFSDNYYDGNYVKTTRAAIKGGTDSTGNTANGFLAFYTDSSGANSAVERMRITHGGTVGINKSTPNSNSKLHVDGHVYIDTGHGLYTDNVLPYSTYTVTYGSSVANGIHNFKGRIQSNGTTVLTSGRALENVTSISSGEITVTSGNDVEALSLIRGSASSDQVAISFIAGGTKRYIGKGTDGNPYWSSSSNISANGSKIWHAGNDGANSGLDSDKLDGQHGSYYLNYNNFTNTPTIPTLNDTLDSVTDRGATTTNDISVGRITSTTTEATGQSTTSAGETHTVGLIVARDVPIVSKDSGGYLRAMLRHRTNNNLEIGQGGTSLINDIGLYPGSSGKVNFYTNNNSGTPVVKARVDSAGNFDGAAFRDISNTAYYINPNGNSVLNGTLTADKFVTGSNSVTTETDILITDNGNIGATQSLNFIIDTDNNNTGNNFTWRKNGPGTTASEQILKLDESGVLTLTGQLVTDTYTPSNNTDWTNVININSLYVASHASGGWQYTRLYHGSWAGSYYFNSGSSTGEKENIRIHSNGNSQSNNKIEINDGTAWRRVLIETDKSNMALTGTPTAPTASAGTDTTQIATTAFVTTAIDNIVDAAPGTLDTLNELAAALGDDADFSTTVTNSIATKLPKAGGTMTGNINMGANRVELGNVDLYASGDNNSLHIHAPTAVIPPSTTTANNPHLGLTTYRWRSVNAGTANFSGLILAENGIRVGTGDHVTDGRATISFGEGTTTGDSMYIEYDGENLSGANNAIIIGSMDGSVGDIFRVTYGGDVKIGSNDVFHDGYHPNADKLTTPRSIAGSSFDGTADISINYNNLTNKPSSLPASGGNADTVDNLHAASFLRSDASDTHAHTLSFSKTGSGNFMVDPGGVKFGSVATNVLAIRELSQLRFGDQSNWDWNKWAGIKFDATNNNLHIGGPASSAFTSNASPPNISVQFSGTNSVISDSDFRAPIFYDQNNTAYYVNPDATGTSGNFAGSITIGSRLQHLNDTNTYLQFDPDRIQLIAGGVTKFDSNQGETFYANSGTYSSGDFDNFTTTGSFTISNHANISNSPPNSYAHGILKVTRFGGATATSRILQEYIPHSSSEGTYIRVYWSPHGWTGWRESITFGTDQEQLVTLGSNQTITGVKTFTQATTVQNTVTAQSFNDYGNSSYYLDPTSTSTSLNVRGNIIIDSQHTSGNIYLDYNDRDSITANDADNSSLAIWLSEGGLSYDNGGMGVNIDKRGPYYGRAYASEWGAYIRLKKSDGGFEFWNTQGTPGGTSQQGTKRFEINSNGDSISTSSSRAPIFYDYNNTAFYVNPHHTTTSAVLAGRIYSTGGSTTQGVIETDDTNQWWIKLQDYDLGIYWDTTNNHIDIRNTYGELQYNGNEVWHEGNDGSGSGLDADKLDGIQASSFLRSDTADSYSSTITATGSNWYLWSLGARGASSGQYGIGNRSSDSYRQLTFHVPNQAAYSSSGTVPSFGWYSNGADQLMKLDSASGNLWIKGYAQAGLYYDKDNTAYRVDPAGVQRQDQIHANWVGIGTPNQTSGSYKLNMGGSIDMNNNAIHYASEVHFQDGPRFKDGDGSEGLILRSSSSSVSKLRLTTNSDTARGYLYANSSNEIGLLDSDHQWAIRHQRDNYTEFRINNSVKSFLNNDQFYHTSSLRAPIFYDKNNTGYYFHGDNESRLNKTTVKDYKQWAHGEPRNNLGSPTVTEMALFDEQFNNKTLNHATSKVTFWRQQTSSSSWTEYTAVSDSEKKQLLRGESTSNLSIPNLDYKFRIEIDADGYTYANALYMYWSSQSHSTQVQIYKRRCSDNAWIQHTSATNTVSSWPGHLYLPFSTIPWHETNTTSTGHFNRIRIEFTPNWSGHADYGDRVILLYKMQIWGGYPAGRRTPYYYDENLQYFFPQNIQAYRYYDRDNTSKYVDPAGTSELSHLNVANNITASGNITGARAAFGGTALGSGEDVRLGGIRGRFSNELIHLYNRVNIGYPSGWAGQGAPAYGLSTHGGAQFNVGNVSGAPFTFNGHTIWHAGNDGSGSQLDADLLDGQHGSYYTGAKGTNQNYVASSTSTSNRGNYGAGLWAYSGYSNGSNRPHTYDATLQVMPDANRGFEISADWLSQTGTPLKVRSLRDCCQGWSDWTTIWTSATDGSGSGLDADLLDGYHASYLLNYNNLTNKPTIPTSLPANGGNADTVDGLHGSQFLRSDADDTTSGYIAFSNQNDGVQFASVSNSATPSYLTSGNRITGGSDYAGLSKLNNIAVQTWFGFSVSPTISNYTVAQGDPAFSVDARNGIAYAAQSMRSKVFYDQDNTNYYVNPNGDSRVSRLLVGDGSNYIRIGDEGEGYNNSYARIRTNSSGDLFLDQKDGRNIYLSWYTGSSARIFSEAPSQFPLHYDRNNTAYYSDPNGTSSFNTVGLAGRLTLADSGYSIGNELHVWKRDYLVNNTSPQDLLYHDGNALPNGGAYRVQAHIAGTGTDQSATAVFWNQNGTWKVNVAYQSGTSSNHPEFIVGSNGKPQIHIDHTSNYTISILHERLELTEGTGTDNKSGFGADGYMSEVLGVLRHNPNGGSNHTAGNRVFTDGYHPNANKWTTARTHTVTLTGQVTGTASQSVDGTGNKTWSIATTLNDSALDDQYVTVGSRHTGNAAGLIQSSKASIRLWDVSTASDDPSGASDGLVLSAGWDSSNWGIQQYHDFHTNDLYLRSKQNGTMSSWDKVFHDTYHPNADKWTTARSLNITGDITGSTTWDGSGNAYLSAELALIPNSTVFGESGNAARVLFSAGGNNGERMYFAPRNAANNGWRWDHEFGYDWGQGRWYFDAEVRASQMRASGAFYPTSTSSYYLDMDNTGTSINVAGGASFGGGLSLSSGNGKGLRFWSSNNYKIYMSSTGDTTYGGRVNNETTSDYNMYFRMSGGTNRGFVFRNGTNNVAGIDASGNFRAEGNVIAYASSDRKLKDNIKPIENALDKVCALNGYTFNWNDQQTIHEVGKADVGVIAQEVIEQFPEVCKEKTTAEGDTHLGVDYERLVPALIGAIRELKDEIESLKEKIK